MKNATGSRISFSYKNWWKEQEGERGGKEGKILQKQESAQMED